jgi:hypothetical protein
MDKWNIFVVPYASNFIASNTLITNQDIEKNEL